MQSWTARLNELSAIADRRLVFVGGAPRSGTTWLQQILDSHPDISCRGEGLFMKQLAEPMDTVRAQYVTALEAKNTGLFGHTGGYPPPTEADGEFLIATAILLALARHSAGKPAKVIGEKTPENVFFFPRLKQMFPGAKFIGIARDPRDLLTSAWHFFFKLKPGDDESAAKHAFINSALPSIAAGARAMIELGQRYPDDCMIVTYKSLRQDTADWVSRLFRFLGVSDSADVVAAVIKQTAFEAMTGGRPAGSEQRGAFLRKGTIGDWRTTLQPEHNTVILRELGWMFPIFGWTP